MQAKNNLKKITSIIGKYIIFILLCINILALACLFLSKMSWSVAPSSIMIVSYLGLFFPFILVGNVMFIIIWFVMRKWKFAVLQMVLLLFFWSPITTYFPTHSKTDDIPENSFKILTYNVRGFNWLASDTARVNPILKYIASSGADIVCLQEFVVSPKKSKNGIISRSEFNEIMKDYPYSYVTRLGNPYSTSLASNTYGIACYSKFPIKKSARLPFESTYNGSAIHELEINGKKVSLVINHLESNRITAEDKKLYKNFFESKDRDTFDKVAHNMKDRLSVAYLERESQAKIIKAHIDAHSKETDATIVCGDFNDTPISYAYNTIKGDMIDAFASTGRGQGITYHENMFLFRIDYIIHSAALQSYNCTVGKVKYSDHYPVWTYLKFK